MDDGAGVAKGRKRWVVPLALAAVLVLLVAAVAVPLVATSNPRFFARYHLLERRYVNLEGSLHEGIGCRTCHETQPLLNGVQLIGDFYASLFRSDKLPLFFTFRPPKRAACLSCHEADWSWQAARTRRIPHPAHTRVAAETRDCVRCHKWTAHREPLLKKHQTMPFSGVCVAYGCHVGTKATNQCFDCHHVLHRSAAEWKQVHPKIIAATGAAACTESCHQEAQCQLCHTTGKTPKFSGMTVETGMRAIEQLHVLPAWTPKTHGRQALADPKQCARCHVSEAECTACHEERPAFHGSTATWIGRHAKYTKRLDDPACLTCHKRPWCDDCHKQFKEMG